MNPGADCDGICLSVGAAQLLVVKWQPEGSYLASPSESTLTYTAALVRRRGLMLCFFL
jgi:hypothetical protein